MTVAFCDPVSEGQPDEYHVCDTADGPFLRYRHDLPGQKQGEVGADPDLAA